MIIAGIAFGGCGSSQSSGPSSTQLTTRTATQARTIPHADNDAQRARFGLLSRAELPIEVVRQSNARNGAPCSPRVLFRHVATGMATSPRYDVGPGRIQQTVALFHTSAAATRAFNRLSSARIQRCAERYARSQVGVEAGATVGSITNQILNVEPRGQQAATYRIIVPVFTAAPTRVAIDVLLNRVGRGISSVSAIWTRIPADLRAQEALVDRIAAHLQRTLG